MLCVGKRETTPMIAVLEEENLASTRITLAAAFQNHVDDLNPASGCSAV